MTAEVPNILAQLAEIEKEIVCPETGQLCVAHTNIPYSVTAADMPLFINYVGPLSQSQQMGSDEAGREFNEVRTYLLMLFHSPFGSGVEGEKMRLLTPYFPLVYDTFGRYPHLKQLPGALDARMISDSGMTLLQFNGQQYFGVRFTLQVTSKVRRLLGEYE